MIEDDEIKPKEQPGLPVKIHGFFFNEYMPFYPIFYAILCEFMQDTFSSISHYFMLANGLYYRYIIILSSEYKYGISKYHISIISLFCFYPTTFS